MGKINKTGRVGTTNKTRRYMWVVKGVYMCTAIEMHNVCRSRGAGVVYKPVKGSRHGRVTR